MSPEPIYEALLERELRAGRKSGEASVLELMVQPGSVLDGSSIGKLSLSEHLLIGTIERAGEALIPRGGSRLLAGDILTVVAGPHCDEAQIAQLIKSARSP